MLYIAFVCSWGLNYRRVNLKDKLETDSRSVSQDDAQTSARGSGSATTEQEVTQRLKQAGINVQETENVVFEGAKAAIARIRVDQAPAADVRNSIENSTSDIIEVSLLAV